MPASQPANFNLQEFTDVGQLMVGGRLYTYAYGTTAQKTAFADPDGTVPHTYTADGAGGQYIALNARGELPAPLYLGDGSYDIALKRVDGSTVWTRKADGTDSAAISLAASFAAPGGSGLVGFKQAGSNFLRSLLAKSSEHVSVEDFGATGTGGDDTAVIQAAINAADGELWFTKANYRVDGQLTWKKGVIYRGRGVRIFSAGGTKITFTGEADVSKVVGPLNASNPEPTSWHDLYFYAPNLTHTSAILFDTGTTYGHVHRCRFYTSGVGIILDQSELWDIERSSFLLASKDGAGVWIVNGPDKQAGSQPYFTNRISVRNCDFNGGADPGTTSVGIYDDGGVAHSFEDNNFNACGSHIVAVGVNGLKIDGGEFEGSVQQSIICGTTKRMGGAGGKSPVVSISRVYVYNDANQPAIAMVPGAVGKLDLTNNVISTPGDPTSSLAASCDEINARGNAQVGAGAGDTLLNNNFDLHPAPCDWYGSNASPVLGNGQIVASYSRRGKIVTFRQRIVFGSTTTPGNGSYLFPLPFPADTSGFAQLGTAYIALVGTSYYTGAARVTLDGKNVQLFVTAPSDVGSATPGAWTPNSVIEFQISYLTAAPI